MEQATFWVFISSRKAIKCINVVLAEDTPLT